MSSMAWDAMQMGLDPVMGPDGREWCESSYRRPAINREIFGNYECDNGDFGKIDLDGGRSNFVYEEPTWFATAQEAQDYAKRNIGIVITRSPDGNGYIVKS